MDVLMHLRGKRVLVAGSTGFIGRHVLRQGVLAGVEVCGASRAPSGPAGALHVQLDLLDAEAVADTLHRLRPAAVLHLAASGVASRPSGVGDLLRQNAVAVDHLCAAAAALPDPPVMVLAGSGVEQHSQDRPLREEDPLGSVSAYGVSKASAFLCAGLHARTLPITWLRLFNVYGPGEREPRLLPYVVASALRGEPVELTKCEQVRDFGYVEDVAECFWRAAASPLSVGAIRALNVGGGSPGPLRRFVELLTDELRRRGMMPNVRFGAKPYRPDEPMVYVANTERLRQVLGWAPATPLEVGIRRSVDALLGTADEPGARSEDQILSR